MPPTCLKIWRMLIIIAGILTFRLSIVQFDRSQSIANVASDSSDRSKDKSDQKVICIKIFTWIIYALSRGNSWSFAWLHFTDSPQACSKSGGCKKKPIEEKSMGLYLAALVYPIIVLSKISIFFFFFFCVSCENNYKTQLLFLFFWHLIASM